jgi:hypothetical protein
MATQHEQERAAVNSAVLKLQRNGWQVLAVDDGEEMEQISEEQSELKQRHQAVEAADATEFSTIHFDNINGDQLGLFIVWGNDPEYVISDITANSDAVLAQVEEVLK